MYGFIRPQNGGRVALICNHAKGDEAGTGPQPHV